MSDIAGKAPVQVSDILLGGKDHGPIEKVERVPLFGPYPPGMVQLDSIERPVATGGGCVRRRWVADFIHEFGKPDDVVGLYRVYSFADVATRPASGCAAGRYVILAGGPAPRDAVAALAHLGDVREGRVRAVFSCTDKASTKLCATNASIRRGLVETELGWVARKGGSMEIFLGSREGGPVTTVRYSLAQPRKIGVVQEFPPPF